MKKLFYLLIGFLSFFFISACEDDAVMVMPSNPVDDFVGDFKTLELSKETENFNINDSVLCYMIAPNNNQISRKCLVSKKDGKTIVNFEQGLTDGVYRLLYFEYELASDSTTDTLQYGLGCRIQIYKQYVQLLDSFDETMQMTGSGTKDDPYIVTCGPHLYNLTLGIKDFYEYDKFNGAYFKQVADISLHDASYYCKHENGWTPIGDVAYPFVGTYDGGGHKITNMYSHHTDLCGVGLFGHITNSSIQNLTIVNADISGPVGVGGVAGCLMTLSGERTTSSIINCHVKNSTIKASDNGIAIGGLVGLIDMNTVALIDSCESIDNTIHAEYNAGGIVGCGSAYSLTSIDLCKNTSSITSNYAGAGGIIGVADTLSITTSENHGKINGAIKYTGDNSSSIGRGVGGICGGSGISWISGCENSGEVSGYEGVGGIIGSTRLAYSEENGALYNSTYIRYCKNSAKVSASNSHVGGLCGEGQLGCFGSLNTGNVTGADHIGGIAGHTSLSVIHNTINNGAINGSNFVAGISALSNSGVYANCQNYGKISATGTNAAGIVGLSGNNTMIHYCSNFNQVSGGTSPVGGIVGEFGDPREWSAINICEVVFGSAEVVLSFLGPACAIIEEVVEVGKTAKYIMLATELSIELVMKVPSTTLWGYGIDHLVNPHLIETLESAITADLTNRTTALLTEINQIRSGYSYTAISSFSTQPLTQHSNNIVDLSNYITTLTDNQETNNNNFNDKINEVMHERAEEIEKNNENKEIALAVIEGVSLVVGTVCAIGAAVAGVVATGGAAAPFIVAGTIAGIAGGASSISKGASDYTDNVIFVTQCVNANSITCSNIDDNEVGGIVGRLHDRGIVRDCLNTGNVPNDAGHIIGRTGQKVEVSKCLTLAPFESYDNYFLIKYLGANSDTDNLYFYSSDDKAINVIGLGLSSSEISNPISYENWNIGSSTELWTIPSLDSGNSFPVPFTSEMTK